jgi:tRNA G18 (ribose-2'-O)-methylase SpoU
MKFLNNEQFHNLNSGMKNSYLIALAHFVEKNWDDADSRTYSLQSLCQYTEQFHTKMSLNEFQAAQTRFEKTLSASVLDHEMLVSYMDKDPNLERNILPLTIVLENIRSAFNVGAIFRSADCLGIKEILLCGYTPTPEHPKVMQTAMGTHKSIPWRYFENVNSALHGLKNVKVIAVETMPNATDLHTTKLPMDCVFMFGNERQGLSQTALDLADLFVKIPLFGYKNSLNVGACMSICSFEYIRQYQKAHLQ